MWVCFAVALVMMVAAVPGMTAWLFYPGLALFAVGLLQAVVFYRCPKCGRPLLRSRGRIPENCPGCGYKLK